jgi:hypothetical protein
MKSDNGYTGIKFTETPDGVLFHVHVQPRASRNEVCGVRGDEIKLRLTAPPVEDAANKLCIEFLAGELKVGKSRVVITAGAKSRHKTIKVTGISGETLATLLKLPSLN